MPAPRHLSPDAQSPAFDPMQELLASLSRLNTFNPPVQTCSTGWKFSGLYSGPTSIAFLLYRLSRIYPDLEFKSQSLHDWATSYLELSPSSLSTLHRSRSTVDSDHCGVANEELAQRAVGALVWEDASLVTSLCEYSTPINSSEGGSDEWLYGRAGYLYLLRLALSPFPRSSHAALHARVSKTIAETTDRIMASPQPWKWHDKTYLGAVHGTAGIISQLILSASDPSTLVPNLTPQISSLLSQQLDGGNFPPSLPAPSDRLMQFCHGAPGIVLSLQPIIRHLPHDVADRARTAIAKAQSSILQRGPLTKAPCLCHGIPTNALALSSDEDFLAMLAHMSTAKLEANAEWMAEAGAQGSFAGLYTGEAGRAWVWAVAEQLKTKGGDVREQMGLIGFSDA